jgi:branched-chain amino acid transport system permease protein
MTLAVYFIAIVGLDLAARQAGRISLGQGAFMAVGAYASAILVAHHGLSCIETVPIAAAVAGAVGLVCELAGGRSLPVVTLGGALALPWGLDRLDGTKGISFSPVRHGVVIGWAVAVALFLVAWALTASRFGRALRAVRDNELAAAAAGVNRVAYRAAAVMLAAAYAGAAGSLLAIAAGHVDPSTIPIRLSLLLLVGAYVGLLGSLWGALLGAVVVRYLGDLVGTTHAMFAFGVLLVAVVLMARAVRRL